MIILMGLMTTEAYNFYVWGGGGWALNPSENFNHWAERNRFQVNDSLVFKNKKGSRRLCFDCEERRLVRRATGWIAECRWLLQFFVIVHFEKLVKELEPADNVGPALQFLKFCSAFRKVLSMILDQSVHPDVLNHHKHVRNFELGSFFPHGEGAAWISDLCSFGFGLDSSYVGCNAWEDLLCLEAPPSRCNYFDV
ncbi:uncharacterized protein LOC143858006 isoform X1 [Tasmannia lanceolata]|uniref:uncharacterized protein LOC143858006 isoform X1 n=1 Tax=Tasmannia lanceolata TaxID=3420 RepID=UPI0040648EF7